MIRPIAPFVEKAVAMPGDAVKGNGMLYHSLSRRLGLAGASLFALVVAAPAFGQTQAQPTPSATKDEASSADDLHDRRLDTYGQIVVSTDADTVVPSRWLVRHVMWAERGADLVVGTAEPVGVARGEALAAWHARHQLVEGHTHVHGANLGVRADRWRHRCAGMGPERASSP